MRRLLSYRANLCCQENVTVTKSCGTLGKPTAVVATDVASLPWCLSIAGMSMPAPGEPSDSLLGALAKVRISTENHGYIQRLTAAPITLWRPHLSDTP